VIVRRLWPADWRANREIRLEALADSPGAYFTSAAEAAARSDAQWQAMVADPDMAVFGLFEAEQLVGLTAIYIDKDDPAGRTAGLAMSYIRPAWRARGLTRLLYEARLDWARERGLARVRVSHRDGNEPSRRAILAHGFRRVGATPHRWPDGATADNVSYELLL
jgi:RimJ/RimL family protein N-acetyltransferase